MSESFAGFPKDSFKFLEDLQANNSREWFEANRDRYEASWKAPATGLTNALVAPMSKLSTPLKAEARINGTLRRINRDVRFSKDKTPYNARMHLIFWAGNHPNRSPAFHLLLFPHGIGYGAGVFGLEPAALKGYRARILNPLDRGKLLAAIKSCKEAGCSFDEPDLKRLPSGFEAKGEWEHLLRRKALVMRTMEHIPTPNWVHSSKCVEQVMAIARQTSPLIEWLNH